MPLTLQRRDAVWTLDLGPGESLLDANALAAWQAALDTVEATPGNAALLILSSDEKFWCNGIDLAFIQANGGMPYLLEEFVPRFDALLRRLALFPLPTLACISGHAYGGGALLAAACDFRTMRVDRGRLCFPEITLKLALSPVMVAVARLLPNPQKVWEMVLTGQALGGEEAARVGLVEAALPLETLQADAEARAAVLAALDRPAYQAIKQHWRRALQNMPG